MARSLAAIRRPRLGCLFLTCLLALAFPASPQTPSLEASSDLSVASVRKALADEHAAIAAHPTDPTLYIQLAYTLVDAGMGDEARAAAAKATQVAPRSALAFNALAWILRHNSIGADFGSGFDYDASARAYQQAIGLDPNDLDLRSSFGNLLEHNREGIDYGPGAQLSPAIDAYRYVQHHQFPVQADTEDNLAIALFYAGRYEEALKSFTGTSGSARRFGIVLAATAASTTPAKAIELSNHLGADEQVRKDALTLAAEGLWSRRLYAGAAELLTASLPNPADRTVSGKIELFRSLKPYKDQSLPASDPRRPVQQLMVATITNALTDEILTGTLSQHSFPGHNVRQNGFRERDRISGILSALTRQTGLPHTVLEDLVLSRLTITVPTPSPDCSAVVAQGLGPTPVLFFVLPEDGTWKIAAVSSSSAEIGAEALYLLSIHQPAQAAALLAWKSTQPDPVRGGDPLGASLFSDFWPATGPDNTHASLLAAASLTEDPALLRPLIPQVVQASASATTAAERTHFDLLLATLYVRVHDAASATPITARLLTQYPDSITAIHLAGLASRIDGDRPSFKALLASRLKQRPADRDLLLESASEALSEGDLKGARDIDRLILDSGHALPEDYNNFAWVSLAAGMADESAVAAAQQASLSAGSRTYTYVLTLACLNAARGNTAEAHQELLDAMEDDHIVQPDADIWFGFGLIFQQYGVQSAAETAFHKVLDLPKTLSIADPKARNRPSTATLAQARLNSLHPR